MSSCSRKLPDLKPCPQPGSGVHGWVFYAYNRLREEGFSHDFAAVVCQERATRPLQPGDVPIDKNGSRSIRRPMSSARPFDPSLLQSLASKGVALTATEIRARSLFDVEHSPTHSFLSALFTSKERVLLFDVYQSQGQMVWDRCAEPESLRRFTKPIGQKGAWLLINPVTGAFSHIARRKSAINPHGRSRRCVESLTAYKYLLLESDVTDPPEAAQLWISALAKLPLPIVSLTTSGGKSVHALVNVGATSVAEWHAAADQIAKVTIPLGADRAPLNSPAYLSRLPGCFREEKQAWQELLYLNPEADGTPISEQPLRRSAS